METTRPSISRPESSDLARTTYVTDEDYEQIIADRRGRTRRAGRSRRSPRRCRPAASHDTQAGGGRYEGRRASPGVLLISSVTAATAGMLYAGRLQSGRFRLGEGDELLRETQLLPEL